MLGFVPASYMIVEGFSMLAALKERLRRILAPKDQGEESYRRKPSAGPRQRRRI
jgi:hypothetical protein